MSLGLVASVGQVPACFLALACSLALACPLALAGGCGPVFYTGSFLPAARAVEQAREADAAEHAPYEFHYAEAHLRKAREEAAESSYEDAIRYAEIAEEFGTRARELAVERRRLRGR